MAKRFGTEITMTWTEWRPYLSGVAVEPFWPSESRPAIDPTTGSTLIDPDGNGLQPEAHSTTLKCMVHMVDMSLQKQVQHQEIETGDVILDYLPPFVRITDRHDVPEETLADGEVYTLYRFNQVNRDLVDEDADAVPASGVECTLESLNEDQSFTIDNVEYVQKPYGAKLSKSWDAIVAGVKFSRPILLRRAT
jgi:hypothetical protein